MGSEDPLQKASYGGKKKNKLASKTRPSILLILIIFFGFVIILSALFCFPKKVEVHKTIHCIEIHSQEPVTVKINGTYYAYYLRNDHFIGSIEVVGKRICVRDYTFEKDSHSFFTDAYGQSFGIIIQYNLFETLTIGENDYIITSEEREES